MSKHIYNIKSPKTALLIIDAQEEYFSESGQLYIPNTEIILENLCRLRKAANKNNMLTIFIKHIHRATGVDVGRMGDFDDLEVFTEGTSGVDIAPALQVTDDDVIVTKNRYSSFVNTDLESILRGNNIDTLLISGLMTQYCSVTTARHAHDLDYKVIFVSDANAGPDIPDLGYGEISHADAHNMILAILAMGVADIQSTEYVIKQLE